MAYGSEGGLSAADAVLLTNRNNDGGFGGNGAWWVIIFLIFAFVGWGRNGFGGNGNSGANPIVVPMNGFGGSSSGAADNYVLASDFATIQRILSDGFGDLTSQARYIQNGICDGFYAMNTGMLNGFNGVQQTLCQGFSGVNQSIATNGYENRLSTQALGAQLSNCCCDVRSDIQGVNYNLATQACDTRNTINTGFNNLMQANCINTRDIIDNQNANYRALHDEIVANRIEDKNAQITAQQNEISALRLAASQQAQNNYLVNQLKPCPIPAYITCNPYQSYNACGCGY